MLHISTDCWEPLSRHHLLDELAEGLRYTRTTSSQMSTSFGFGSSWFSEPV